MTLLDWNFWPTSLLWSLAVASRVPGLCLQEAQSRTCMESARATLLGEGRPAVLVLGVQGRLQHRARCGEKTLPA